MKISFELPIRTVSEANDTAHWTAKSARHQQQQFFVRLACDKYVKNIALPCEITMTRMAPRFLDDDNLRSAFKWVRDEISEYIIPEKAGSYTDKKGRIKKIKGRADSDSRIGWEYAQEKNLIYAIRIEIIS